MVAPLILAGVAIAGGVLGALGGSGEKKGRRDAEKALAQAVVPELEDLRIQLERAVLQGQLTPAQAQQIFQQQSQLPQFEGDPSLRGAQTQALEGLRGIVETGGITATTQANINQIQDALRTTNRGEREALLASFRARGISGSGVELAASLAGGQQAAQLASTQGTEQAALAEQARQTALLNLAQTGGTIRTQEFGQAESKAAAQDAINRFNAGLQATTQQQNVDRANRASELNLAERQRIADVNVNIANQQEIANRALPLTIFEAQLAKAKPTAEIGLARQKFDVADATRKRESLLGGLKGAAGAFGFGG